MAKEKIKELKQEIDQYKNRNSGSEKKRFDELEHIEEYWKDVDSGLAESLIFLAKEIIELRSIVNQHDRDIDNLYGLDY